MNKHEQGTVACSRETVLPESKLNNRVNKPPSLVRLNETDLESAAEAAGNSA